MSTDIAKIRESGSRNVDLSITRFWGGTDNGVCVQIGGLMEEGNYGYIQLSAYDLIALIPILKQYIIDVEMERVESECDSLIKQNKELKKTIIQDQKEVSKFVLGLKSYDLINMALGKKTEIEMEDESV